jgi:GAF domain-containing protein
MKSVSDVPPPELSDLARLAEGDENVEQVLRRIVGYAATLVPSCVAACLTVRWAQGHETAAASDGRVQECHAVQFSAAGNGPGRETLRWSEPRRSDDLREEERWPEFAATAVRSGFRSCLALPLRADRNEATALNLYSDDVGTFEGTTFDVALLFAAQGGVAFDNAGLYRQNREMVEHLHRTLTTRSVIERAKGVLMSRHGISSEDAFLLLQRESQHSHRKLRDVAWALLEQHQPGGAGPEVPWTPPRTSARAGRDREKEST